MRQAKLPIIAVALFCVLCGPQSLAQDANTKYVINAWWQLTYACRGGEYSGPALDGGDPAACEMRAPLQ